MTDLSFITDGTIERICGQRERRQDMFREIAKRKLHHVFLDAEQARDALRAVIVAGGGIDDELEELRQLINDMALMTALLEREANPVQQAAE